ncbi:MAG: glycosyltransferase family A protein [bacterium]
MARKELTIGIAIRNEERAITLFMNSLVQAVKSLSHIMVCETIACVNGSSDNSSQILFEMQQNNCYNVLNLKTIQSKEGKIEAQKAILKSRSLNGRIVLIDADTILDTHCLVELWNYLVQDDSLKIVYANIIPMQKHGGKQSFTRWIQQAHYDFPDVLTPRKYIHGRCFMFQKGRNLDEAYKYSEDNRTIGKTGYDNSLNIDRGALVDDIYLSRYFVHKYGVESIKQVQKAKIYFAPPCTLRDFYHGQRRMVLENIRMSLLFPDFEYIQARFFKRSIQKDKLKKLKMGDQLRYLAYHFFEKSIQAIAKFAKWEKDGIWTELRSTKIF